MDVPTVPPTGQYVIYALIDPTDHRVCYVGQTCNPQTRLAQHLAHRSHRGEKGAWLRSLEEKGHRPIMQILERVTDKETALAREQVWIRRFLERGMPLMNSEAKAQTRPERLYLKQAILPTRQETATICGCLATRLWLPNGQTAIVLKSLADQLGLNYDIQLRQIRYDPVISRYLVHVSVQTRGGPQITNALLEGILPIWLAEVRQHRLPSENQEEIQKLQQQAADVLCDYFSRIAL